LDIFQSDASVTSRASVTSISGKRIGSEAATIKKMSTEKNQTWLPVVLIAGALIVWMGLLAAGAYWAPSGEGEGEDPRKLWVVAATTGGFLLLWAFVLVRLRTKLRRRKADSDGVDSDGGGGR